MVKTTNCYYTVALNDFTNGATAIGTTSADDLAADLGSGWQVKDGKAVPVTTSIGITDPVFSCVTIDNTNRDVAFTGGSFKGTYTFNSWTEENTSILFVGTGNSLYWPKPSGGDNPSLGAFRAYFQLSGGASVRELNMNFGEGNGDATRLNDSVKMLNDKEADAWYSLDGRKLNGQPTARGIYVKNGRKVVIK